MASTTNQGEAPTSQAELLYQAQLRKERLFRTHVGASWAVLFFILIFLFSGQNIQLGSFKFETIQLDTEFILKNLISNNFSIKIKNLNIFNFNIFIWFNIKNTF